MDSNVTLNLERDLQIIESAASDLKDYLLSPHLFWTLSRTPTSTYQFSKGTIGRLLFCVHRLNALQGDLTPDQLIRFRTVEPHISDELDRWSVQAEDKAHRDIKSRLNNWTHYLEELQDNSKRFAPEYPTQAEGRTVISLLIDFSRSSDVDQLLHALDTHLQDLVIPADFIWNAAMQRAFPREDFWWLYVTPRIRKKPSFF